MNINTDSPWLDTWDFDELGKEYVTMDQYAKIQKQECKEQWLTFRKWGTTILRLTEEQVIAECARLEKAAYFWQEEIDELIQQRLEGYEKTRLKTEADERFKIEGWPTPLGIIGTQTTIQYD